MSFNPDITKQGQEIIFSRKENDASHPGLYFNNSRSPYLLALLGQLRLPSFRDW